MKKEQVRVGEQYTAKVSGGVVPVQIREERWIGEEHKGWIAVNTLTGRSVTIKSAQRLRAQVAGDVAQEGGETPTAVAVAGSPVPMKGGKKGPKAAKPVTKDGKEPKAPKLKKEGPSKLSGLDAAAKVLSDSKKPMTCKEIVADAFKRNLWKSEGATPEATIYAAIIREIAAKGSDARFKKVDRGQFTAA